MANRQVRFIGIAIALGQIKDVAGVRWFLEQRLFQNQRVFAIGLRISRPGAVRKAQRLHAVERSFRGRLRAVDIFVNHIFETPLERVIDELRFEIGDAAGFDAEVVGVPVEPRHFEARIEAEHLVGIDDQQIVGARAGQL